MSPKKIEYHYDMAEDPQFKHCVNLATLNAILEESGPLTTTKLWLKIETLDQLPKFATVNRLRRDLCHFWRTFHITFVGGKWWTNDQWDAHRKAMNWPEPDIEQFYT